MSRKRITHTVDDAVIDDEAKNPETKIFAKTLSSLLEEKGIHQRDFAQEIGVSTGIISYYRHGKKEPTLSTIIKMADTLGVDCHYLMTGVASEHSDIYKDLKLSDGAVNQLKELAGTGIIASAMDELIKSPHFKQIVFYINGYIQEMQKLVSLANNPASEPSDIYETISAYDLCEYYASKELGTLFTEIKKRETSKSTAIKTDKDGQLYIEWRQDSNAKH